jgi:Uma2 family endonuclease
VAAPVLNIEHILPWTEEDYFALGETSSRIELFDGSLLVSPAPTVRHQNLALALRDHLLYPARKAGLTIYLGINVRLRPGRVPIPDLVIGRPVDPDTLVVDAGDVELICEITSTDAATDRVLKMHYYAEAGISRYLLVDPKPLHLSLYRLDGKTYVEEASAGPGETLLLTTPIVAELDPASLDA